MFSSSDAHVLARRGPHSVCSSNRMASQGRECAGREPMSAHDSHAADDLLTIDQAAALLNIQPKSVQAAIRRGVLPTAGGDMAEPAASGQLRRPVVEAYSVNRQTWKSKVPRSEERRVGK